MTAEEPVWSIRRKDSRTADKVKVAGLILILPGVFLSPYFTELGMLILVIGFCIPRPISWSCGHCGGHVAPASALCPSCENPLVARPYRLGWDGWCLLLFCGAAVAGAMLLVFWPELFQSVLR